MTDIVQRLREAHPHSPQYANGSYLLADAADEIERLRAALGLIASPQPGLCGEHLVGIARGVLAVTVRS